MGATDIERSVGWEDADASFMGRVTMNGANITQSDVTTINRKIFDLDGATPETAIDDTAVAVSSVVFDTLQTDGRWTKDGTGYNFRNSIAGAEFPNPDRHYLIEFKFTGNGGEIFFVVYEYRTKAIWSS